MERTEFEKLVNREIDGLLTPEEEARLNDYTSRDSAAAHEQRALHEIHRTFQDMERPEVPVGLADRIADRVLAGPAPVRRFPSPRMLNKVAAAILVVAITGFGGWWLGNGNEVTATKDAELEKWRQTTIQVWVDFGFTTVQAEEITEAKEPYRDSDDEALVEGKVLTKLQDLNLLEVYCEKRNLTLEQAEALIASAAKAK